MSSDWPRCLCDAVSPSGALRDVRCDCDLLRGLAGRCSLAAGGLCDGRRREVEDWSGSGSPSEGIEDGGGFYTPALKIRRRRI